MFKHPVTEFQGPVAVAPNTRERSFCRTMSLWLKQALLSWHKRAADAIEIHQLTIWAFHGAIAVVMSKLGKLDITELGISIMFGCAVPCLAVKLRALKLETVKA